MQNKLSSSLFFFSTWELERTINGWYIHKCVYRIVILIFVIKKIINDKKKGRCVTLFFKCLSDGS